MLPVNGINEGNVRGCHGLPFTARRWRRWGEGGVAVSSQELPKISRYEEREGDAASYHELGNDGINEGKEKGCHQLPLVAN